MKSIVHNGVYGILTKNDSILLVLKSRGPYKNLFDLPGGSAKEGESQEQTLLREIAEETGVTPKKWELFDTFNYQCEYLQFDEMVNFQHRGVIYTILEFEDEELDLERTLEDVKGCEWHAISSTELLSPFAKNVCNYLIQYKKE